jgi:hypothetical protein
VLEFATLGGFACAALLLWVGREAFWRGLAWVLSRDRFADAIIARGMRSPYAHVCEGGTVLVRRYWLFNRHDTAAFRPWIPFSVGLHHRLLPDPDKHPHDHPWHARTIVLRGGYVELRNGSLLFRSRGQTASLCYGQFHRISHVFPGGAWAIFITGPYLGNWGYAVDGKKVHWREYAHSIK